MYFLKFIMLTMIITHPFPFITIEHLNSMDSKHINTNMNISDNFKTTVQNSINNTNNTVELAKSIAAFVRSHLYANTTHPKNHDVLDSIHHEEEMPATCSGYSRLTVATANALGYNARVVWTQGHTISEVYIDGWKVIDSTGDLMYNKSITDIHAGDTPITLTGVKGNDENYLDRLHKYENNPVIVMIDTEYLDTFAKRTTEPTTILKYIAFDTPVATGKQYSQNRTKLGNIREALR